MNMQDKEMDQLFRAKLDNYEIEPSANVWANISSELNQTSNRKSYMPLLRIAASVLVLVSAGLFFLPKKQAVTNPPKNNKLAMNPVVKPATIVQPGVNQQTTNPVAPVQPVTNVQPRQQIAAVVKHTQVKPITEPVNTNPAVKEVKQIITEPADQQMLTVVDTRAKVTNPVMPEGPITLKAAEDTHEFITKPANANAILASNPTDAGSEAKPAQKRKAHGLGGFLNKVIAAVDKRDDKIIEFTDTDEGDSITGINLGIIKVKKVK